MLAIRSSDLVSKAGSGLDPAPNTYRGSLRDSVAAAGGKTPCVLETHRYPHAVLINETGRPKRQLSPGSGEGQSHRNGHEALQNWSESAADSNQRDGLPDRTAHGATHALEGADLAIEDASQSR